MPSTFDPKTLVTLPRLTALSLAGLLHELLSRAKHVGVPKAAREAHDELHAAHKGLGKGLKKQIEPALISPDQVAADRQEDAMFGAMCRWARAITELVDTPEADVAHRILGHVYPTGLDFTQLSYREEWQAAETRLATIAEKNLDKDIEGLGGKPFLDAIKKAHKHYGEALGVTTGGPVEATGPAVRTEFETARNALRAYVVAVSGTVVASKAKSGAVASSLLEPFTTFESPVVVKKKKKKDKKGKAPEETAAAGTPPPETATEPPK